MPIFFLITLALLLTLIPLQGSVANVFGLAQESDLWNFDTLLIFLVFAIFQFYGLVKGKLFMDAKYARVSLLFSAIIITFSILPRPFLVQTDEVVRLLLIIWLLPVIAAVIRQLGPRHLTLVLLSIACLHAIWGISQFIVQENLGLYILGETQIASTNDGIAKFLVHGENDATHKSIRAYGPYTHPNILASILSMNLLGIILVPPLRSNHSLLIPLMFVLVLASIVSFSRGAWISLLIAAVIYVWQTMAKKTLGSIPRAFALVGVTLLLFMPLIIDRLQDQDDKAVVERVGGTEAATAIFKEYPFLGVGAGNYTNALVRYYATTSTPHHAWEIAPVHSIPLLLLTEWGIIGTLLLAAAFGMSYMKFMQITPNAPVAASAIYRIQAAFIVGILPLLLLDHYFITQTAPLVWLMVWWLILGVSEKPSSLSRAPQSIAQ